MRIIKKTKTKMKNSSLQVLVRPPHCKSSVSFSPPLDKKKKNPASPDYSQLARILWRKAVSTWCSRRQQLLAHTQQPPCVRVSVRKSEMQRRQTLRGERSAQGQGKTWSGVAATSAACIQGRVVSSCASLVMSATAH